MIPMFRPLVRPEAAAMVADTLASGYIGEGPRAREFEAQFGAAVGAPVLAINSCTSALDLALHLAGVGPDTTVVTTAMTCTATNTMIVNRGARLIWADVDPITGLIRPESVVSRVRADTRAVMAVDWAGRYCDYPALRAALRPGMPIIQDAAHVGPAPLPRAHGDYVAWSTQAIKHLTTGDGGLLLVPDRVRARARLLRWYGLDRESSASFRCEQNIVEAGYKYHMNDIAASIGLANIGAARHAIVLQRQLAQYYTRELRNLKRIQTAPFDATCSYWLYTVLVESRDEFAAYMAERGIETSRVHARNDSHDAFRRAAVDTVPMPGLEFFDRYQVSIPCGWWVGAEERRHIVETIREWSQMERVTWPKLKSSSAAQFART